MTNKTFVRMVTTFLMSALVFGCIMGQGRGKAINSLEKIRQFSAVRAISRTAGNIDTFRIGKDGIVRHSSWNGIGWTADRSIGGYFPAGASVSSVSRLKDHIDLFVAGNDGRIYTSWWHEGQEWSGINNNWYSLGGFFPPGADVAVVSRTPKNIDLFVTGNDGKVYTSWWREGQGWSGVNNNWLPIGGYFPVGASVSAISRSSDIIDLFVTGNDGKVYTSWWREDQGWSGSNNNWLPIGGFFPPGTDVAAVSRTPKNLDLFITGNDGKVYTSWWYEGGGWSGINNNWLSIGGFFPVGASISTVSRANNRIDLFIAGNDGKIYTSWWNEVQGWSGANNNWLPIGGFFPTSTVPSSVSRTENNLDVFVVGQDGRLYTSWWSMGNPWSGANNNWYLIGSNSNAVGPWSHSYTFPTGVPVGGSTSLSISADGSYKFSGNFHDSGFPSYDVGVACIVKSASGTGLLFTRSGHLHGTIEPGSRDFVWDIKGKNPSIVNEWNNLAAGSTCKCDARVDLSIGSIIDALKQAVGVVGAIIAIV